MNKRPRHLNILGRLALAGTATGWLIMLIENKQAQREESHQGVSPPVAPELTDTALVNGILMRSLFSWAMM